MTLETVDVPVDGLRKFLCVYEGFLRWLQRSHLAPSANSLGFAFCGALNRIGGFGQTILIRVTIQAIVHDDSPGRRFGRLGVSRQDRCRINGLMNSCSSIPSMRSAGEQLVSSNPKMIKPLSQ